MRRSLFQPCENTTTSVSPASRTSARNRSRAPASVSPSLSKVSSQNRSPAIVVISSAPRSYRLQCPHEVEQAAALEVRPATERGRRLRDDLLDVVRPADELPPHRQQRGDRAGHVRC